MMIQLQLSFIKIQKIMKKIKKKTNPIAKILRNNPLWKMKVILSKKTYSRKKEKNLGYPQVMRNLD